jgi:hypothetical protein
MNVKTHPAVPCENTKKGEDVRYAQGRASKHVSSGARGGEERLRSGDIRIDKVMIDTIESTATGRER